MQSTENADWVARVASYSLLLLSCLHIFINSFLFLHFALEFARCPYRILQINYVDVDVDVIFAEV